MSEKQPVNILVAVVTFDKLSAGTYCSIVQVENMVDAMTVPETSRPISKLGIDSKLTQEINIDVRSVAFLKLYNGTFFNA